MNGTSLDLLLQALLAEQGTSESPPSDLPGKRRLLRALMNIRPPGGLTPALLAWQDEELARQREEKGVIDPASLLPAPLDARICLWRGDITRLACSAIVNAANAQMLGCFSPLHNCIDNAIHSAAGMQLREECAALMAAQKAPEPTGQAKPTRAYNLPCQWVIHTVGPIVRSGRPTAKQKRELASCYASCLELASARKLDSLAFCCISTGVFGFPQELAAEIAVQTVTRFLAGHDFPGLVIFDVFTTTDLAIYERLLGYG